MMLYSTHTWDLVQALESASPASCNRTRTVPKSRRRRQIRKAQRGRGFLSSLKKNSKKSTCKTNRKTAPKNPIDYAPQLYNLGTSKIKNKTARKILQSDTATNLLNNLVTKCGSK